MEGLFSLMDWAVIFVLILLFFGPEKLPHVAQTIGKTIREVKKAFGGLTEDIKDSINLDKTEAPLKPYLPEPPQQDYSESYTPSNEEEDYPAYPEDAPPAAHEHAEAAPHQEAATPDAAPAHEIAHAEAAPHEKADAPDATPATTHNEHQ